MRQLLALALVIASPVLAQSDSQNIRIVLPKGPGSITARAGGDWKFQSFFLFNDSRDSSHPIYRPVVLLQNERTGVRASYILMLNDTKAPTSEGCRESAMEGALKGVRDFAKKVGGKVTNVQETTYTTPDGRTFAVFSHVFQVDGKQPQMTQDMHASFGDARNCATIHLSKDNYQPGDEKLFQEAMNAFTYDTAYVATTADYQALGTLLAEKGHEPASAAIYYARAVETGGNGVQTDHHHVPPQPLTFALANHPGYLHIDAPNFAITELSAKPNGIEFGIRAKDKTTGMDALGFLYLPDGKKPLTSASCMQSQLESELRSVQDQAEYRSLVGKHLVKTNGGVELAIVEYAPTNKKPRRFGYTERVFVAAKDVCADVSLDSENPITMPVLQGLLDTMVFDADRQPDFFAKFRFATVLYDHHEVAAAAPIFESALALASTVDDSTTWRRIATDQASMSYGMAGDLKRSRAVNEAAIAKDPDYPLYYYNLACADAESGDAIAARTHLQQAFDRRANTIKGEKLPDPTADDSILKLKNDKAFWAFVQSLPKS